MKSVLYIKAVFGTKSVAWNPYKTKTFLVLSFHIKKQGKWKEN